MANEGSKVLWVLPRSLVNVLVGALLLTYIVSLIWSWVLAQDFAHDNGWVAIILWLIFAAVVGFAVAWIAQSGSTLTLWLAAAFTAVGFYVTQSLMAAAGGGVDNAILASLGSELFLLGPALGALVLGVVGAATAAATAPAAAK